MRTKVFIHVAPWKLGRMGGGGWGSMIYIQSGGREHAIGEHPSMKYAIGDYANREHTTGEHLNMKYAIGELGNKQVGNLKIGVENKKIGNTQVG
jgi:hypothetical protein